MTFDPGRLAFDFGLSTSDLGLSTLDFRLSTLDFRLSTSDLGLWTFDLRLWTFDLSCHRRLPFQFPPSHSDTGQRSRDGAEDHDVHELAVNQALNERQQQ